MKFILVIDARLSSPFFCRSVEIEWFTELPKKGDVIDLSTSEAINLFDMPEFDDKGEDIHSFVVTVRSFDFTGMCTIEAAEEY